MAHDLSPFYIGVDVGTGSVRASLVGSNGAILASSIQAIDTYRDPKDHRIFEQSTTNIWSSISSAIRTILDEAKLDKTSVKGIGFDATCSLAVVNWDGDPIIVTSGEQLGTKGTKNVILWADHRAEEEADIINKTGSVVLDYVGGTMSIEMDLPKILWLKRHMPPSVFPTCQFFDLPDYLTYRATGSPSRSCCSLTCKCSFIRDVGWEAALFDAIGLGEFCENGYKQIGVEEYGPKTAGTPLGAGLSRRAAEELGLLENTPVGSALIDAYAGWMGTIAAKCAVGDLRSDIPPSLEESAHRLAVVAGTSTCHLVQSRSGVFVKGVWGPYKDAVLSGWCMNEGGQSSTGQLIEFVITTHPAYNALLALADERHSDIYQVLQQVLESLRVGKCVATLTELTKDMHLYPDLHGNRSPIADPRMRGSIVGLELDDSLADLAKKYHLTLESIALQTRHIIDTLNAAGHCITTIYVSGGQVRNSLLMKLLADVCRINVVLPGEGGEGAVVRGAAMLGRFAAEVKEATRGEERAELLWKIMVSMTPPGTMVESTITPKEKRMLEAKYGIFLESIEIQKRWREQMNAATHETRET